MKFVLFLAGACLLSACASAPVMQTSINGVSYASSPTSATDPRLRQPRFYMDESDAPAWLKAAPPRVRP